MLKRELKSNLKSFIIWTLLTLGIYLLVLLIYPEIVKGDAFSQMDELLAAFPKDLLTAFNMDITSIETAFGWLKSEGYVFLYLIIGCYSSILGSSILLKEESDKTIEYLHSLPIKRTNIVLTKALVGLIYVMLFVLIIGLFNFVGLTLGETINNKEYLLVAITPLFPAITTFFIVMFLSTFTHKTKKVLGISLGFVLISYILNTISSLSETVEFLKYASVFTLADLRNVIQNLEINPVMIFLTISISLLFLILTIIRYNKKELV